MMFGGTFAVVIDTMLVQFFFEELGPYFIFIFCGVISLIGLCLCMFFDPKLDIDNLSKRGMIQWGENCIQKTKKIQEQFEL